ncbi:hypothetical protein P7C73_g2097, partial [Tremellales sp. Uapishka_1]
MAHPHVDINALPASAADKSVFFTGITGYIGGTVLTRILALPHPPKLITALIRDPAKAERLSSLTLSKGVTLRPLIGSLDDLEKITAAVAEHDIVISTASADHLDGTKAIIEGMRIRKEKTGHRPLIIHTSGTGVLTDDARGMYPTEKIYTDLNPTHATAKSPALLSIATLPSDAPHRPVDIAIVVADASSICKSYIILPSNIYGEGKGEIFDLGIAHPESILTPRLIEAALDRGQAGMVGEGLNIWNHVHISDVGDLFQLIYAGAISLSISHGTAGYYFAATGEFTYFSLASTIGSSLVELGRASSAHPTTFTQAEMDKYFGEHASTWGTNSRAKSERAKMIGWRPKYTDTETDFLGEIKPEILRHAKKIGKK